MSEAKRTGEAPSPRASAANISPGATERRSLRRLRELLLSEGGLIAELVGAAPEREANGPALEAEVNGPAQEREADGPAQLAAGGPRARERGEEYELLIEAIYEGYLLHFGTPRVVLPPSADLGVLVGDRLYALGLDRLVALGDIDAVAELADVITLTALAHADGHPELADALWQAGARAVGWGPSAEYERVKALVRSGSPAALADLHALAAI